MTQHRDGRLSVLMQFLLGAAGFAVTALAVFAFDRANGTPRATQAQPSKEATDVRRLRTGIEAQRQEATLAEIRARRAAVADTELPTKCIAGTLFREIDDAWTNVGPC